jgi:hypothetical protein
MRMRLTLLAPALLLAACGQQEATPEPPAETPIPVEPDGGIGDGARPPEAVAEATIPQRFLGVWDSGDCSAGSEMRLEVTPGRLEYYESVGTLTAIEAASGGDVLATLAMSGEGQSWRDTVRLQLTEAGGREALLVLPGPDSELELRPVPRFRCPA